MNIPSSRMYPLKPICKIVFVNFLCVIASALSNDRSMQELLTEAINIFTGKPVLPTGTSTVANVSTQSPAPAHCAQQCTRYMRECAQNEIPGFEKQMWSFQYEPTKLETYCQIHENGTECLRVCPESTAKTLANKGLDIGRQICNDSAIRSHAQCITEVVTPLREGCESNEKCGKYPLPEGHDIRPSSMDQFQRMMRMTCLRLKCNLECASSAIIDRCGQSAEHDVEIVVRTAARYLKVLTDTLKVPRAYAVECGVLANLTDTTTENQ